MDAGAEVFDQLKIAEDTHQLAVTGHGSARQTLGETQAVDQPTVGGDADAIGIYFDHRGNFGTVVVMDDGVDQSLAQGAGFHQAMLFTLGGTGDAGEGAVLDVQLVEHAMGRLDQ